MQLIEVRCCCDPCRLLGWMRVPLALEITVGQRVRFRVPGQAHAFGSPFDESFEVVMSPETILELEFAEWSDSQGGGLALKSNDTPIETLCRVPGFLPISDVDA